MSLKARLALASFIGIVSLLAPPTAGATAPAGPNGDLVFTSGRAPNTDATAKIWTVGPTGGTATQVTTTAGQNRQPNWSPDHTKIAYAVVNGANTEIRILDLATGTDTQFVAPAAGQDRPTWSPDGTKIAYGNGNDIFVKPVGGGTAQQITNSADLEERPVWSPDGNTIYYNRTVAANDNDLYKKSPVALGGTETPMVTGATNDWQVNVSPDGARLCFLRGPKDNNADLYTASAINPDPSPDLFADDPGGLGSLNCVWSPDGTKIAYTQGAFSQGTLVYKELSESPTAAPHTISGVGGVFDGNADWAVNFRPTCQNATINVGLNGFANVPLGCTDQDIGNPAFIDREIVTQPSHGNLGSVDNSTDSVVYTPAKDFSGTDTFTFRGSDGNSSSAPATITVKVGTPGDPTKAATISAVSMAPRTWRLGSALPAVLSRAPVGTTISFRLSKDARATLTFSRRTSGRRVGRRCRKATRKNRKRRRCSRYVRAGSLTVSGKAGTNRVRFQGRLSSRQRLRVGRYRLVVGARDSAGNRSKNTKPVSFRIVRR